MFDLRQKKIDEIGALLIKNRVVLTDYVIKKTHAGCSYRDRGETRRCGSWSDERPVASESRGIDTLYH